MLGRRIIIAISFLNAGFCVGNARGQTASSEVEPQASEEHSAQTNEASVREKAKALYEEGLSAYRAGRYSDAVDKLLEADQVMPNAAFSYNIAVVYEAMGDKRSALRWLRSHIRQSGDDTARADTLAKVRKLEVELQAQGIQQVTILSKPPGATVWIDGHALGITPFTTEIVPGSHSVSLGLEGYSPEQKAFELRADRALDVTVALTPSKVEVPPSSPRTALPETSEVPRIMSGVVVVMGAVAPAPTLGWQLTRVRPWTWIGLGVGTALLGGATLFELKRRHDEDEARAASQRDYQSRYDEIDTSKTVARVLAVTGVVTVAAGLTLFTVDWTRPGPVKTATLGSCGTSGLCAAMRGQF